MAQIDRVIYFPMLVWFIILFLLFYFVIYFMFLPVIYTSLKGRSLFFLELITLLKRINKGFKFFVFFFKKYGLFNFFNVVCYVLKIFNKANLVNALTFIYIKSDAI